MGVEDSMNIMDSDYSTVFDSNELGSDQEVLITEAAADAEHYLETMDSETQTGIGTALDDLRSIWTLIFLSHSIGM